MAEARGELVFAALDLAVRAHRGQFRKGTDLPYIIHPLNVAKILIAAGGSDEVVSAGMLHDVLEDTNTSLDEIRERCGGRVAELVNALSEPPKSEPWETRKQHTLDHLRTASVEVLLIAAADKLDNIRAMGEDLEKSGDGLWSRFNRPREQQRWYYQALADIFVARITDGAGAAMVKEFLREVEKVFQDSR